MNRTVKQKPRKQLDPAQTRAAILEAAFDAFAATGFAGASIADVAELANVPKSLVQYHFGSKEELWQACVAQKAEPMLALVDRFMADESIDIGEIAQARMSLHQRNPQVGRLLAWTSLTPTPVPLVVEERRNRVMARIDQGGVTGRIEAMLFAFSTIDGYFLFRNLYRRVAGEAIASPEAEARLLAQVLEVLKKS
jgi:AcrR family transcriptional regulator